MCPKLDKVKVIACNKSTHAGKIPKWKPILRNSYVINCNGTPINSIADLHITMEKADDTTINITFGTMEKQALHPQSGVPQLYFDQIHHIGQHLFHLNTDPHWQTDAQREEDPV